MKAKSKLLSSQMRRNNANRDKLRAHAILRQALRRGETRRGRCEICGSSRVDGHHPSYDQPIKSGLNICIEQVPELIEALQTISGGAT